MDATLDKDPAAPDATKSEMTEKVDSILHLVDDWKQKNFHANRNYAELLRHFNGGNLTVAKDKEGKEVAAYANFNVARSRLQKIGREMMSIYYSKMGIFDLKITGEDLKKTPGLELAANEALAKIFRSDMRFTPQYETTVQDAILCGRGVMWRRSKTHIIPERARLLADPSCMASVRDDSFAEWAFESTVKAADLFRISKSTEDPELKSQAAKLLKAIVNRHSCESTLLNWPVHEEWEDFETVLRTTTVGRQALATVIPCYWYFEKDLSGNPGKRPVTVFCVARHGVDLSIVSGDDGKVSSSKTETKDAAEGMIFRKKDAFDDVTDCVWLLGRNQQFGGAPTLGACKGEGEIQYTGDIRIQKMLNSMVRRIEVENLILLKNTGGGNKNEIDNFSKLPISDQDIIPEGVDFVEKRFGDKPLAQMMGFVDMLSGYAADHAAVDTGHTDAPQDEDFKAQVMERLQDRAAAKSVSESAWTDGLDKLATALGVALFDSTLVDADEAKMLQDEFFKELEDAGFKDIKPKDFKGNVRMSARRMPGHGDPAVAMARADANIALAQMTGPEAVKRAVFEKAVLVNGGDYQKAITLLGGVPDGPAEPQSMDVHIASAQMSLILSSGVQLAPQAGDNPFVHTMVQMSVLENMLGNFQKLGGWTAFEQSCWDAALAHAIADVMRMPMEDAQKESMKRIKVIQMAAYRLEVFKQGEPEVDPLDLMKLQQNAEELARKKQKDLDGNQKWVITQQNRETMGGRQMALQERQTIVNESRLEKKDSRDAASQSLNDAISLNEATRPEPPKEKSAA